MYLPIPQAYYLISYCCNTHSLQLQHPFPTAVMPILYSCNAYFLQLTLSSLTVHCTAYLQRYNCYIAMKIWITRLNGKVLTEYTDDQDQLSQSRSEITSSSSILSYEESKELRENQERKREIALYNKRALILQIIDHSRKLSVLQYDSQLNYVRLRGYQFFYVARHKLLFIYGSQKDEYSVLAIENILNNCVRGCEVLLQNICTGKLPNYLTDYQLGEFEKLSQALSQIVAQEDHFQLKRSESFREPGGQASSLRSSVRSISERSSTLCGISEKELRRKEHELSYLYETDKKVNKYRFRLCLLLIFAFIVTLTGLYCLLRDTSSPLPFFQ